jgi:peptidoglycan/LPS O-acetylase OafA/YrhL
VSALGLLLLALVAGPAGESSLMPLQIPAVALLSAALITGLVSGYTGWIAQVLHWKPLVWLGGISYGIYLFHLPILDLVIKYGPGPWLGQVAAAVLLAVGFAALSYRFVEKPMLRLKSRV